jgi:hypothetical protein
MIEYSARFGSARKSTGPTPTAPSTPLSRPLSSGEKTRPKITPMMTTARIWGKKNTTR